MNETLQTIKARRSVRAYNGTASFRRRFEPYP